MKAVILAGGLGSRLSEETATIPKPMVTIGGRPILWHIMKIYEASGINDFIVLCGYKSYVIKEYFANYALHSSDFRVDLANGEVSVLRKGHEDWTVTLIDTGDESMTGGRVRRIRSLIDGTFCLTYGDGVADINVNDVVRFHEAHGKWATMTTVIPPARFGTVVRHGSAVDHFIEKPMGEGGEINGGFFVLDPKVFDFIEGDHSVFESDVLPHLAKISQLMAFHHSGFWQAMDTLRDRRQLEEICARGNPPWLEIGR